jgi:predicted NAD/FAD-binding protein
MNPIRAPQLPQSSQVYFHPLISAESILMARQLDKINGVENMSFAGAWMGFGFHEDGFRAGAHVGRCLIDGRHKVERLDLVGRVKSARKNGNLGWGRYLLKMGVLSVQWVLDCGKI